ncbi:MAG TPA: hypothetical protein VMU95_07185 [Trebonia sp.]|nr:hypothetical protein [Trebonia sp.]
MREQDQAILHEILRRGDGFGQRQHVELAWRYLGAHDFGRAADTMGEAIRQVAAAHGQPGKYHETITRAWARCVAVHQQRWPGDTFAGFIDRNPQLLDSGLLSHFYSPERLRSAQARESYVEPDLRPLPSLSQ